MVSPVRSLFLLPLVLLGCQARTAAEDPVSGPAEEAQIDAMNTQGERRVDVSVLLVGSDEEARRWLRERKLMERWLADGVTLDPVVGGELELSWFAGSEVSRGKVVNVVPGRSIEFAIEPFAGSGPTSLRFSVNRDTRGTRFRVEQWPFSADAKGQALAQSRRQAWFESLRVLQVAFGRHLPTTAAPPPVDPVVKEPEESDSKLVPDLKGKTTPATEKSSEDGGSTDS